MSQLRVVTKLWYGSGQIGEGIKNNSFELLLFFYYNQVLGLSGTLCGVAMALALISDAVSDPLAGSLSDSLRSRWGRRHPFMYASALPLALTFFGVFNPPGGMDQWGLFIWLATFTILTRTAMTLYHVPHLALGAELSEDYEERTTIVAYRTFMGLFGVLLVSVVGLRVFFPTTQAFERGQLDPSAYGPFSVAASLVMAATILASGLGTHSRIPTLAVQKSGSAPFSIRRLVEEVRDAMALSSFRALFVGLVIFFAARGLQTSLSLHVTTHFWDLDSEAISNIYLTFGLAIIVGVPFWTRVARRLDKKPTFLIGVAWFTVFQVLPVVMKLWFWFPPATSPAYLGTLYATGFLSIFGAAAALVTAGSMLADLTDQHELATGRRQEGIFFGAQSFAGKSASGLGHLVAGVAIDWIGFPTNAEPGQVAPEVIQNLGIIYGPGLLVVALVSIAVMSRYRLHRAEVMNIQRQLAGRRASPAS